MPISPIITSAGLTAVLNATNDGLSARITHVALGDAAWTPDNSATALQNERQRVAVSNGSRIQSNQIHITAVENGTVEYWIRELGFFLDDGTLLAVWSDPDQPLAYKAAGVDVLLAFDLLLSALPDDSVEVVGTGGVNLPPATDVIAGVLRFATESEERGGVISDVAISPEGVRRHGDNRYARRSHHHDSVYASRTHDHDSRYSRTSHLHDTRYARTSHNHDGRYSLTAHEHDDRYSRSNHSHNGVYSRENHNHDTRYSPRAHHHDARNDDRYSRTSHLHDGRYVVENDFRVTWGFVRTLERRSEQGWTGYNDWDHNYAIVRPPAGFTLHHLMGFIPTMALVYFGGSVDANDQMWCLWSRNFALNEIRVICANSENRPDATGTSAYFNYVAIWQR